MSRHSEAFKRLVVDFYRGGERSSGEAAAEFGLDRATVRKWVASYAAHGMAGLAKKFSHYDADFKLSVLRRMWDDGLSRRQTAAIFNIRNAGCLSDWERRYERGGIDALAPRRTGRLRSMPEPPPKTPGSTVPPTDDAKSREELLAELNHLRMENAYLKKLEALTRRPQTPKGRKSSKR
jgi:transposase